MAHHQQNNRDQRLAAQGASSVSGLQNSVNHSISGDDEATSEDDEPPHFSKLITPIYQGSAFERGYMVSPHLQRNKKESLLTQALLTSPELTPLSDAEAPVLTSDGGLTSPARTTTPSPPPVINHGGFTSLIALDSMSPLKRPTGGEVQVADMTGVDRSQEIKVEEGLGRRRCISFACGRQTSTQKHNDRLETAQAIVSVSSKPAADLPKRPCMLKFACPMKPPHTDLPKPEALGKLCDKTTISKVEPVVPATNASIKERRNSASIAKTSPVKYTFPAAMSSHPRKSQVFNRIDFQKSEATRFHEFAGPFNAEDEWINEQTAYRQKITINDTLRKENAIRKLAEEAEEEALEEEADQDLDEYDDSNEFDDEFDDDDRLHNHEASDGGNETDDEEGFADSDDESDGNSEYQFWTPGPTTAATSTDQFDHIHLTAHRTTSESSIELESDMRKASLGPRKPPIARRSPRMRPGTPELPDDAEFVIGTLDEDRPLEDAYRSCLEERRRLRHKHVSQDIDPSFPTSEPDADNDDDDEENATQIHDEPEWVTGRPDSSGEEYWNSKQNGSPSTKASKFPMPSPKHIHSSPRKRGIVHRSPPPRRLFGQATHRLRSPPPMHRKLTSPPSSRRPSVSGSAHEAQGMKVPHLAQRPNLTHTTSLPRTPNPFWDQHRRSRLHGLDSPLAGTSPRGTGPAPMDFHSRGPIDIVQGLESKRQRRKEKFWRQHCRNAGKEKERRCQPGKGAERMRELGLEMADRCKWYGQKPQLVLSV